MYLPLAEEGIDTLILGCTHYPPLMGPVKEALSEQVKVIDPAVAVAEEAMRTLRDRGLEASNVSPKHIYAVTDNPERFKRVGERYLVRTIDYIRRVNL